jgi:5-oxoprolinase (ATP-hydrolysing) subunit C
VSVALRILAAGPAVTLQDAGRYGYFRFGVTAAGPMDPLAFATANLAAGAPRDAAAIEVSLGGITFGVEGGALSVAVAGGAFRLALDDRELVCPAMIRLTPQTRLSVRAGPSGAWCYVAIAGHLDIAPTLGSVATHLRTALGGIEGRALRAGDLIPVAHPEVLEPAIAKIAAPWLDREEKVIRVVLGPQDYYFSAEQIAAFLNGPWTVSTRSDRMAYLLEGVPLSHAKGFNIISDGIAMGAIQIPGNGQPVVLMADRQPTGGYPKIANVIGADLGRLAQLRGGQQLRFKAVSIAEAVEARRAEAMLLSRPVAYEQMVRTDLSSEFLLSTNLVDGMTAGYDEPPR